MPKSKTKKEGAILHCNIRANIMDALNQYCEEMGYSKTFAVETALKKYLGIKDKKFVLKSEQESEEE